MGVEELGRVAAEWGVEGRFIEEEGGHGGRDAPDLMGPDILNIVLPAFGATEERVGRDARFESVAESGHGLLGDESMVVSVSF